MDGTESYAWRVELHCTMFELECFVGSYGALPPLRVKSRQPVLWSRRPDSNRQPTAYEFDRAR
jgi:hypothetical protein